MIEVWSKDTVNEVKCIERNITFKKQRPLEINRKKKRERTKHSKVEMVLRKNIAFQPENAFFSSVSCMRMCVWLSTRFGLCVWVCNCYISLRLWATHYIWCMSISLNLGTCMPFRGSATVPTWNVIAMLHLCFQYDHDWL